MAIKIRLTRGGSKKRPFYRVVAADSRMPRDGRFIEKLGTYSPLLPKDDPNRVDLNIDKINEWLKKGAQVSDRISRLLENLSVLEPKKRDNPKKGKKHKATLERETAKSEKQSNNQEEISSEEKTNNAEESPDIKDVSEGETLEEKTNDADANEVNDKKNKEVDKDLELNENKTDDSNETETKQNQEEEKKVSNEEKVDDNLKSEEPKEK
jgi:small subunit ribosomal protein S16